LTITVAGFAEQTFSELLHPGEAQEIPPIMLNIAAARTTGQVGLRELKWPKSK